MCENMILKVVTVQRIIKVILAAGVLSCLLYVALIDFSLRPNAGVPIHVPGAAVLDGYLDHPHKQHMQVVQPFESVVPEKYDDAVVKTRLISEKIKRLTGMVIHSDAIPVSNRTVDIGINYNVHIFYYCPVAWWTTPENAVAEHSQELNIVFYPELGIYNCNAEVIAKHFRQINKTGIGVVLYSWQWSTNRTRESHEILEMVFSQAKIFQLKVSFVLEHFKGRTVQRVREDVEFIFDKYSQYESFNRIYDKERREHYPVFYIKDTLQSGIEESSWRQLLGKQSGSIRKTKYDAIFLNHIVTKESLASTKRSGFDGLFSYSASNGDTYASTWKNWQHISRFAEQYKMLFVPSLGPGHAEKMNKEQRNKKEHTTIRHRANGNYYGVGWRTAIQLENDPFISISSFNNWPLGTQIEPAVQRSSFRDYSSKTGNYSATKYLDLTRYWIGEFTDHKKAESNQHFCHVLLRNDTAVDTAKYKDVKGVKQRTRA